MSSKETTPRGQSETISFELDLPHSAKKIWRALTDPELLAQWLLPAVDLKLEPDAAFTFKAPPQPGWDGDVKCRVLEIEEQKKLSYAWAVGDIDTIVTFTLQPSASGTLLSIVQSGWKPHQKQNFGGARYGWRMMSEKLATVLARDDV